MRLIYFLFFLVSLSGFNLWYIVILYGSWTFVLLIVTLILFLHCLIFCLFIYDIFSLFLFFNVLNVFVSHFYLNSNNNGSNNSIIVTCVRSVAKSCSTLRDTMDEEPARLLCPWDSPGKNTGVGCHFLHFYCHSSHLLKTYMHLAIFGTLQTFNHPSIANNINNSYSC